MDTWGVGKLASAVKPAGQSLDAQAQMNLLWTENRSMLLERLDMLERECWRWLRVPDDLAAGVIVRDLSHKMAAVLGTFGMKRGSLVAASIERMVAMPRYARGSGKTLYALLSELRQIVRAKS